MALALTIFPASRANALYCAISFGHVLRSDIYALLDRQHEEVTLLSADHQSTKSDIYTAEWATKRSE